MAVALEMKAPVKLELSRTEDFMTSMPAPAARVWLKMGVKKDGAILCYPSRDRYRQWRICSSFMVRTPGTLIS